MADGIKIPPKYVLFGNLRIAGKFSPSGGKLLAKLKEEMGFGGLQIGKRTHNFGDNIFIRVSSFFGIDKVEVHALGHGEGYLGNKRIGGFEDPFVENIPEVPGVPGELPGPIDVITQDPSNLGVPGVPGIHSIPGVPGEPAEVPCVNSIGFCDSGGTSDWTLGTRLFEKVPPASNRVQWDNPDNLFVEGSLATVDLGYSDIATTLYIRPPVEEPLYDGLLDHCYNYPDVCNAFPPHPYSEVADTPWQYHFNYDKGGAREVKNLFIPLGCTKVYIDYEIRWYAFDIPPFDGCTVFCQVVVYKLDANGCIVRQAFDGDNFDNTVVGWRVESGTWDLPNPSTIMHVGLNVGYYNAGNAGTGKVDYVKTRLRYEC